MPIADRLALHGDRLALVDRSGPVTYTQLDAMADAVAEELRGRGIGRGAFVAVLCAAGRTWVAAAFGAWRVGAAIVPLESTHPVADLAHPVTDADVAAVLCSTGTVEPAAELAVMAKAIVIDVDALSAAVPSAGARRTLEFDPVGAGADALVVYTSGTTGKPKGVVHTHASVVAQITGMVECWGWSSADRIVGVLPLHHVHGIVNVTLTALWIGAVLEAPGRFDAADVWERFASGEPTLFMAVPTIYARLSTAWEAADAATRERWRRGATSMRLMVSGSAALPVRTLERWREISGQILLERYGMTEIGMALGNTLDRRVSGHVGWPFPGVEVRIESPDGGIEIPGELLVRSSQVFDRYLRRPDATAQSFDDGWFRTGDVALDTPDGFRLLGRASIDIIKSGGEKVSALEIEEEFRTHPTIADCAVVGLDDDEWGQRVAMAWIPTDASIDLGAEELRAWGRERLAPAKVPFDYRRVAELPRNPMGKVVKSEVTTLFDR